MLSTLHLRSLLLAAVAALALASAAATHAQTQTPLVLKPDLPGTKSNHRLILKDGSYQVVRTYQIAGDRIQTVDPETGRVIATIPTPDGGASGMAWADGMLWVGQHRARKIHKVDPETGAILRTLESNRFVTGVTWVDGELWHATWEGDESEIRRIDPQSGEVLAQIDMPPGVNVSGLESDGGDTFFCGGGGSGKVRTVRRPK